MNTPNAFEMSFIHFHPHATTDWLELYYTLLHTPNTRLLQTLSYNIILVSHSMPHNLIAKCFLAVVHQLLYYRVPLAFILLQDFSSILETYYNFGTHHSYRINISFHEMTFVWIQ